MVMESSLLVDEDLYGDGPHEDTALNWPPPMALADVVPAIRGSIDAAPAVGALDDAAPELHLWARAARASRGPILVIGTAVTVALSGGYAAGHAFGWKLPPNWKLPPKLSASVSPTLTTLINERIPALVARPGTPLWCPAEEAAPSGEGSADTQPPAPPSSSGTEMEAVAATPPQLGAFESIGADRRSLSIVPRLRFPLAARERPPAAWHGVVWSPRAQSLVSLTPPGATAIAASQPAGGSVAVRAAPSPDSPSFVH